MTILKWVEPRTLRIRLECRNLDRNRWLAIRILIWGAACSVLAIYLLTLSPYPINPAALSVDRIFWTGVLFVPVMMGIGVGSEVLWPRSITLRVNEKGQHFLEASATGMNQHGQEIEISTARRWRFVIAKNSPDLLFLLVRYVGFRRLHSATITKTFALPRADREKVECFLIAGQANPQSSNVLQ